MYAFLSSIKFLYEKAEKSGRAEKKQKSGNFPQKAEEMATLVMIQETDHD